MPGIDRLVKNLPKRTLQELQQSWIHAITTLADKRKSKQHADATRLITAIGNEWGRRYSLPFDPTEYFKWPTTEAAGGDGSIDARGWLPEGVLKGMGYTVGANEGLATGTRKLMLDQIFRGQIPPMFPPRYMEELGSPGSARRLKKMAETIAALVRNAKRRRDSKMAVAIEHWEHDLEYLYYKFYVNKFHFDWPSADVV